MQPRERNHVRSKLAEIAVELARESERAGDGRQARADEVIQITVSRRSKLQGAEAYVVQSLIVKGEAEVRVLDELVHRKRAVVGFNHRVRHLRAWHDRVSRHDAVRVLLANLRDEEGAHPGAGATAQRVSHLEALEAIASLSLFTDNV